MKSLWIGLLSSALTVSAYAQPAPPDRGNDAPPPPADQQDGPPPPGGRGGQGDGPGGMRPGPGMREGQGGGAQNRPGNPRQQNDPLGRMLSYLEIVERYAKVAQDGTSAGVAAVIAANDLLRPAGNQAAIDFFTKQLEETKNITVKRAIRLQLVDLYRLTGEREKALEHLKVLMNEAPASPEAKP